ncbi:MAG: glycosyltransferase family 39 protein, partial [Planctomycetota bacterium]|nr:glycosyltransferase family 39 protein [Planctomycetota bacterium]
MPTSRKPSGQNHPAPAAKRPVEPSPSSVLDRLDRWLVGHRAWTLAAILVASVLLRAGYYLQLSQGPCLWQHRWDQSDMNFFDSWARQIAAGDVLSKDVKMPLHGWHKEVAQIYYAKHPNERSEPTVKVNVDGKVVEEVSDQDARKLWEQWCGNGRFYQDPLYSYLLAGVYKLFGPDVRWMFLFHMLAGVAGNVLIYLLARRFFGETTAVLAAALAVACGPILYYELVLVRETFISLAGLILVYMTVRAMDRKRWTGWLALGAATGAAVLLKSHFWAYLAGVGLAILLTHRKNLRALAVGLGALAAGFFLAMTPLIARNLSVGAPAMTSTTAGG